MKPFPFAKPPRQTAYLIVAKKPIGRAVRTIRHDWVSSQDWAFFLTLRGWRVIVRKI